MTELVLPYRCPPSSVLRLPSSVFRPPSSVFRPPPPPPASLSRRPPAALEAAGTRHTPRREGQRNQAEALAPAQGGTQCDNPQSGVGKNPPIRAEAVSSPRSAER